MAELELTDASFDKEVLQSSQPVLVDLWAPWCGPCRMLAPVIEELAKEYAGKVKVAKLNTDDNAQTAVKYKISAIPTLMLVKGGKVVDQIVGVLPKAEIKKRVDALLA
jgi:thioredoxin 1